MASGSSIPTRRMLWGGVILWAAIFFQRHWIEPLRVREKESMEALEVVRGQIDGARTAFREVKEKETAISDARKTLSVLQGERPFGSAATWLPAELKSNLGEAGIVELVIRQNAAAPETGLPEYERTYWRLTLPRQEGMKEIKKALLTIAEIEQRSAFVRVLDLSLRSDGEEPYWVSGGVNLAVFSRK